MRILVAEDNAGSLLILKAALKSLGHDCVPSHDGEEAWQLFQRDGADVVVSDRKMPGMDGIELCRRIRRHDGAGYTYFIFLTGFDERAEVISGMEAGADDYLIKPLDVDELKLRLLVASRVTSLHRQLSQQSVELERLNRELFEQSRDDALTSLGNRLKLREDLEIIATRAERYGHGFCAVMCDVDFFKAYNDSKGHLAGDEVLRVVARTLTRTCRSDDQLYRFGGEEFLLLLPEQSLEAGLRLAERCRQAIEDMALPHGANPASEVVTISAGVASLTQPVRKSTEVWLQEADAALYRAKQSGRNRVVVHDAQRVADERRTATAPASG
jgi:two-component system cell cycle response regulator